MIVTNVSDELITEAARKNWLDYWKHFTTSNSIYCSESNCCNIHTHGVIVKKTGSFNAETFIIPLCENHNNNLTCQMEISSDVDLIPSEYSL